MFIEYRPDIAMFFITLAVSFLIVFQYRAIVIQKWRSIIYTFLPIFAIAILSAVIGGNYQYVMTTRGLSPKLMQRLTFYDAGTMLLITLINIIVYY